MKKTLSLLVLLLVAGMLQAQVENPGSAVKTGATDHANSDINSSVNNGLNKTEGAIKGIFKKKKKTTDTTAKVASSASSGASGSGASGSSGASASGASGSGAGAAASDQTGGGSTAALASYKNYDFVPGDKIIFQSALSDESTGEIPSQFTLMSGQMDVQQDGGENVIHTPKGPGSRFTPRMKNMQSLPDQFTVEFDFKDERFGFNHLDIYFGDDDKGSGQIKMIEGDNASIGWSGGDVEAPQGLDLSKEMTWHHIAIAVNKNVGKVYADQFRWVSVNNLEGKASKIVFNVHGYEHSWIKNIRIAAGGIDIYKEVATDNKIVTHGILFDVDKATIRPESMGTINSIVKLLQATPGLKFEIDGHTDNSGTPAHNLTLSQQRADAVRAELVSLGIEGSRLTTKGYGDTKPIGQNDTPENKAINRRVEFVKIP